MTAFYPLLRLGAAGLAMGLLAGCRSMEMPVSPQGSSMPNLGGPVQDVRTEAKIIEMENEYIAEKNSQPSHQPKAARKAKEKAEQEKQAKAAGK